MNNKLNLTQIKQCEQVWNKMELVDGGRLCKKCDKVMVDFRGMDDYEIAEIHINSEKVVCGIYDEFRLSNNPNFAKPKLKLNKLYIVSMFGLLINSQVEAKAEKVKTIQTEPKQNSQDTIKSEVEKENIVDEPKILRGVILNEEKNPLSGVAVFFKEIRRYTLTNEKGYFELNTEGRLLTNESLTLAISYIGYKNVEVTITEEDLNKTFNYTYYNINKLFQYSDYGNYNDTAFAPAMEPPWYKKLWRSIIGIFD